MNQPWLNNFYTNNNLPPTYSPTVNVASLQHYDIITVNGKQGADAFQMGPNSRILLLDEKMPIVWLAQTDGAGYKTITPYDITPHQPAPQIDLTNIEARLKKLEDLYEQQQSNLGPNKSNKRQRHDTASQTAPNTDKRND